MPAYSTLTHLVDEDDALLDGTDGAREPPAVVGGRRLGRLRGGLHRVHGRIRHALQRLQQHAGLLQRDGQLRVDEAGRLVRVQHSLERPAATLLRPEGVGRGPGVLI